MTAIDQNPSNRDLSALSELLALHTGTATPEKPKARALAPANDNKPARPQLAWPAFERLAHRGDFARLFALRHWRDMCFPRSVEVADDDTDDPEVTIETKPSEGALLTAIGWKVVDRERWHFTREYVNVYETAPADPKYRTNRNGGVDGTIGSLAFRDGKLIQWGTTKKGAALRPVERPRGVKGASDPSRSDSAIWSYIHLLGATSPLTAQPYAKPMSAEPVMGDCYSPLPREEPSQKDKVGRFGVEEARDVLRQFGVDGGVPFHELPVGATRCADGLVAGQQWVGGVKKPKPLGEISTAAGREPEFVRHVETTDYIDHLRRRLGQHANVLDLAIADTSAKDVGIAMGLAPAYAEKRGPSLIEAAIDALIDIDETARGIFQPIAQKVAA